MNFEERFERASNAVARATGRPVTFVICVLVIVIWAATGPLFGYSDTWQLIINTGTTIVTFLMVFLIQNTQNRDGAAIQAKLDELIRASSSEDEFIGIEHLTEKEVDEFRQRCMAAAKAQADGVAKDKAAGKDVQLAISKRQAGGKRGRRRGKAA